MLIQKVENELGGWKLEAGKPVDPMLIDSLKTLNVSFAGFIWDEVHGNLTVIFDDGAGSLTIKIDPSQKVKIEYGVD